MLPRALTDTLQALTRRLQATFAVSTNLSTIEFSDASGTVVVSRVRYAVVTCLWICAFILPFYCLCVLGCCRGSGVEYDKLQAGDVLLSINGSPITHTVDISARCPPFACGTPIVLRLRRGQALPGECSCSPMHARLQTPLCNMGVCHRPRCHRCYPRLFSYHISLGCCWCTCAL